MTFVFNRDYHDLAQVEPFIEAYEARLAELTAEGRYPYNDDFKGHLGPDVEGRAEDIAIYLLQSRRHGLEYLADLVRLREEGFVDLDEEIGETPVPFAGVVEHGFYSGPCPTGVHRWDNARLVRWHSSLAVLPKGRRSRGNLLSGKVMVLR